MSSAKLRRAGGTIFITGTDTGVGKTVLTGLLLYHLRQTGIHALAVKPFCSGSRADAKRLCAVQDGELQMDEINPFFFQKPLAPLAGARDERRPDLMEAALASIRSAERQCERLLVEGVGGLLVPLGEKYSVLDLISELRCNVMIVGRNQLGTINHTRLTVEALRRRGLRRIKIVLMEQRIPDLSSQSNAGILRCLLPNTPLHTVAYLGFGAVRLPRLREAQKKIKKTLARILE